MRLIDADKLLDDIDDVSCAMAEFKIEYAELVDEQPTVDAQPVVHGEWIYSDESTFGNPYGSYKCSICGNKSGHKDNYCCNCGAREAYI